ncbi:MAG: hypothetical protein FWE21_05720 [Defluviitaleaceae bacterium]|nr:hypothetical protein [Defluviitaleaceae bacterium]
MENFIEFLQGRQALCLAEAEKLARDNRMDEANLQKAQVNIFGIFVTVAQIPNQPPDFLEHKIEEIPLAWHKSLEAAIKHGDFEKETVERAKIATMEEIKAELTRMQGG